MTPWTVLESQKTDGGTLLLVTGLHPDYPAGHWVQVSDASLENRRGMYLVGSDAEALELVLWEHYVRLNPGTIEVPPAMLFEVWGPGLQGLLPV